MRSLRAVLWLWYRGARFRGWQRQVQGPTVQQEVEEALRARGIQGGLAAAGRTDRGVHARQQICSLRVPPGTDLDALAGALGGQDWGCAASVPAAPGFHAQWTPSTKEYRYRLCAGPPPPGWAADAWNLSSEPRLAAVRLDGEAIADALSAAVGTRDFVAFHAASSVRRPRTLAEIELFPGADGVWELRLVGDGFGRYQVRALVGGASLVAAGRLSPEAWRSALEHGTPFEGLLAPPRGLILWSVRYAGWEPFPDGPDHPCPGLPPFVSPAAP